MDALRCFIGFHLFFWGSQDQWTRIELRSASQAIQSPRQGECKYIVRWSKCDTLLIVEPRRAYGHDSILRQQANTFLQGFWFADVTVGDSDTALELLLDTGSADLVLNPCLYTGGPNAVNLQNTFDITYGTTGNSAGSSSQTVMVN